MEMYRVKYGRGSRSAASWGEWKYYENQTDNLMADLTDAYLDVTREKARGNRLIFRLNSRWRDARDFVLSYHGDERQPYTDVFEVAKLVDGEWRPVKVTFIAPQVVLNDDE